jgi:hypothetical protein
MSKSGRKRNRNPLGERAGENRFKGISQIRDCLQSVKLNMEYNPLTCYENNGAEPKIKYFDDSASVVYTALQTGMSYPQVTSFVNMTRLREGKELICCSAVQNFIRNSKDESVSRRTIRS